MINDVLVNNTVRIKVKFIDINAEGQQVDATPTYVIVKVYDSDNSEIVSQTATQLTDSEYYYDFTPTEAGEYKVTFVGTMEDNSYITVNQQLYVSTPTDEYRPLITLRHEEVITFAPDVNTIHGIFMFVSFGFFSLSSNTSFIHFLIGAKYGNGITYLFIFCRSFNIVFVSEGILN